MPSPTTPIAPSSSLTIRLGKLWKGALLTVTIPTRPPPTVRRTPAAATASHESSTGS